MLLEHNGVAFERPVENESNNGAENIPENDNNAPQNIPAKSSAESKRLILPPMKSN